MLIDLTHSIHTGMPVFPGDPEVVIKVHLDYKKDHCRIARWNLGSHTGTHMDAPSHFIPGGISLDKMPVNRFVGRGVVADLRHLEAETPIIPRDLETVLADCQSGDFLVLHTGWDRYWGLPLYDHHPHLSLEAARLVIERGISLLAIDTPDIENAPDEYYPVHQLLLEQQCLIVENLCGLEQISHSVGWFTFMPLKVEDADGSPIRALYQPCP